MLAQRVPQWADEWKQQGQREALRRLLTKRFGALPEAIDARIEAADQATLDAWFERAIEAPTLTAVFGDERT